MSTFGNFSGIDRALSLSFQDREKGGWLWPQFVVAELEEHQRGSALELAIRLYQRVCLRVKSDAFRNFFLAVVSVVRRRASYTSRQVSTLSKEIWYDKSEMPNVRRGLTRILDATECLTNNEIKKYRIEIARAIQMSLADDAYGATYEQFESEVRLLVTHATQEGRLMSDPRRLELPGEISCDEKALELISVWSLKNKVKVMTREGTSLDDRSDIWGEIVAGIVRNIAEHLADHQCIQLTDAVAKILEKLKTELE